MSNKLNSITQAFKNSIHRFLSVENKEYQVVIVRSMITTFHAHSIKSSIPMVEHLIDVVYKDFPHLKDEVDKLLILL